VISCPKCAKENQDHYKFCLGCGAELPKDAPKQFQSDDVAAPRMTTGPSPGKFSRGPSGAPPAAGSITAAPPPAPEPPAPEPPVAQGCPQCGHENPVGNRFCASCGYKLAAAPAKAAAPAPLAAAQAGSGVKLTALKADGSEAGQYELPLAPAVTVGRDTGTIFAGDSYLSPRHATFTLGAGSVTVRDEDSLNGVYVKLGVDQPFLLEPGAVFRIGQEIIRFEALVSQPPVDGIERFGSPVKGIIGRLALVIGRESTGNAFPIPARGLHLGRERGDVLFSEDGYVSGLHCRVAPGTDGGLYLTDVGSSNGTFVRVGANHALRSGDILLMGQQVFRIEF
jgi:pSer/pThr/pTyr-binding forkhead associated (FHA) protein